MSGLRLLNPGAFHVSPTAKSLPGGASRLIVLIKARTPT
jgi:hypothetical protein